MDEQKTCGCQLREFIASDENGKLFFQLAPFCPLHAKAQEMRETLDRAYNYIVDQQFGDNNAILDDIEALLKEIDEVMV